MAKAPAIQFYVRDFTADCNGLSVAAKGAWIQIMCQLHLATKRGELTKTHDAWARICGCPPAELEPLLKEFDDEETARVTFCNGRVTVVSRRMERERKEKEAAALRTRRHRAKTACHENVTTPSAVAVSAVAVASSNAQSKEGDSKASDLPQREVIAHYISVVGRPGDLNSIPARDNAKKVLKKHALADLKAAADNYAASCVPLKTDPEYRYKASNFYGRAAHYENFMPGVYQPAAAVEPPSLSEQYDLGDPDAAT